MGKSSVFAAWERAYFVAADVPNLNAAARRYGFILIAIPLRHYAALPVPDANRPESWILEIVRRQLEQHDFTTRDLGLVGAVLRPDILLSRSMEPTRSIATSLWRLSPANSRKLDC